MYCIHHNIMMYAYYSTLASIFSSTSMPTMCCTKFSTV